jgi:hypothetical protein
LASRGRLGKIGIALYSNESVFTIKVVLVVVVNTATFGGVGRFSG